MYAAYNCKKFSIATARLSLKCFCPASLKGSMTNWQATKWISFLHRRFCGVTRVWMPSCVSSHPQNWWCNDSTYICWSSFCLGSTLAQPLRHFWHHVFCSSEHWNSGSSDGSSGGGCTADRRLIFLVIFQLQSTTSDNSATLLWQMPPDIK